MQPTSSASHATMLDAAYRAFNARDLATLLGFMTPDVAWPKGMTGVYLQGQDAVGAYWTELWQELDAHLEPLRYEALPDGRVAVTVQQVARDWAGAVLVDGKVRHVYGFRNGLIQRMDIQ